MRVYADTSVFGGYFDEEFSEWSMALFIGFKGGIDQIMLSDLTLQELEYAPDKVRALVDDLPDNKIVPVENSNEAVRLAEIYIKEGTLTNKSFNDALHIAIATINIADVLASWNFKYIVNLNRIRLYNSINMRLGYKILEIRTPREILNLE